MRIGWLLMAICAILAISPPVRAEETRYGIVTGDETVTVVLGEDRWGVKARRMFKKGSTCVLRPGDKVSWVIVSNDTPPRLLVKTHLRKKIEITKPLKIIKGLLDRDICPWHALVFTPTLQHFDAWEAEYKAIEALKKL